MTFIEINDWLATDYHITFDSEILDTQRSVHSTLICFELSDLAAAL